MNERAHLIDIDSIVLHGAYPLDASSFDTLIEAEVARVLRGTAPGEREVLTSGKDRVAGEVARVVMRSVNRGNGDA
jgi:hypothetical protein